MSAWGGVLPPDTTQEGPTTVRHAPDEEVEALSRAWGAIRHLDPDARIRVVQYLADRSRAEAECPFEFKTGRTA